MIWQHSTSLFPNHTLNAKHYYENSYSRPSFRLAMTKLALDTNGLPTVSATMKLIKLQLRDCSQAFSAAMMLRMEVRYICR
jgi:hypothetical protein